MSDGNLKFQNHRVLQIVFFWGANQSTFGQICACPKNLNEKPLRPPWLVTRPVGRWLVGGRVGAKPQHPSRPFSISLLRNSIIIDAAGKRKWMVMTTMN
jgi:hypothetical protein